MTQPGSPGNAAPDQSGMHALRRELSDIRREMREMRSQLVNRGVIALPVVAVTTPALFSCAGDAVWRTDPLESPVTVNVNSGKLLVVVSAVAFSSVSASNVVMSWTVTDSHGNEVVHADNQRALVEATAGYPAAGYGSSSYFFTHLGLAPGVYSVRANYRCDQYGAPADVGYFENRSVTAWPV